MTNQHSYKNNKTNLIANKKRILVADDDPAIVESITMILEEYGFEVESTVDGETIYKMEKIFPDLLILDIWMSGQDGRDICRYLKNKTLTNKIPIIMISASNDIKQSAIDSGADDFLAKPFDIDSLMEMVYKNITKN